MERVLEQKIKRVVEGRTDTPAMLEALQAIAAFYGQQGGNTAEARKSLRQDLEKQNMVLCDRFVSLFEVLRTRLDSLEARATKLEGHCQAMHARIGAAEQTMSSFLTTEKDLQERQTELNNKADQISAFLDRFILSSNETQALLHEPIDVVDDKGQRPFFLALSRVQEIRTECSKLVGSKHQSAGFEMLETLSEQQEAAFRRLHAWVLERCSGLGGGSVDASRSVASAQVEDDDMYYDAALAMGLRAMRERPALLVHCQECLQQRRRDIVRRHFLVALTQSAGGGTRPIEMQAHDPVRYVGDMLAWVHQTIASERELLANIFGESAATRSNSEAAPPATASTEADAGEQQALSASQMVSDILEGTAALLKVRVGQVLDPSGPVTYNLVLCFRLLNLLAFYDNTLRVTLALEGSAVVDVVTHARVQCQNLFSAGLRRFGDTLVSSPPAYSMDLSASPSTAEAGRQLSEILQVYSSSLIPAEGLGYDLDAVLSALIEPVLRACRLSAEGLDPSDAAVLMLNNVAALQSSLSIRGAGAAAERWSTKLGDEAETWVELLVRYQSDATLDKCGLNHLLERAVAVAKARQPGQKMVEHPGLDVQTVATTMRVFYAGLFGTLQFEKLQSPQVRQTARQRTRAAIADAHRKAYELFSDPEAGYEDKSFLVHTPEQVDILLD